MNISKKDIALTPLSTIGENVATNMDTPRQSMITDMTHTTTNAPIPTKNTGMIHTTTNATTHTTTNATTTTNAPIQKRNMGMTNTTTSAHILNQTFTVTPECLPTETNAKKLYMIFIIITNYVMRYNRSLSIDMCHSYTLFFAIFKINTFCFIIMMEDSNAPFDIRTLYNSQVSRTDHRHETYNVIARRVYHRVQTVSQRNDIQCIFQLPQLVVGMPLYDPFECCGYLIRTLKKDGFLVKYYHPNILYINWSKEVIENRVNELNAKEKARKRMQKIKAEEEAKKNIGGLGQLPVVTTNKLNFTPTGKLFQ